MQLKRPRLGSIQLEGWMNDKLRSGASVNRVSKATFQLRFFDVSFFQPIGVLVRHSNFFTAPGHSRYGREDTIHRII